MGRYFGTDGIRGRANKTLNIDTVYNVGRFVGNYFDKDNKARICIGMDTRLSSAMFENTLAAGLASSGADVYLIGYCSTPCLAYTAMNENFSCGIMISASHNPYHDNGIKIFGNDGLKIKDDIETLIEDYIDNPTGIEYKTDDEIGKIVDYKQAISTYQNWIKSLYPLDFEGKKICVDLCNGSNCYTAKDILDSINADVTYINDSPTGININNGCGSTHLESLQNEMKANKYDLGFAFDGDADRVLFVNEDGDAVDGDSVIYLLAKYLKDINKLENDAVVVTVMSNIGLFKALDKLNIKYDVTPVGDKNVVDSMIKNNYVIGGEQSGHIICTIDSLFGDGLKTAMLVMKALAYYKQSLKQALKELRIYPQLLINEKVKDKNIVLNDDEINSLIKKISDELGSNGRILVRPSGTEPLIRVMVEAETDEICKKYTYLVTDLIKAKGYTE